MSRKWVWKWAENGPRMTTVNNPITVYLTDYSIEGECWRDNLVALFLCFYFLFYLFSSLWTTRLRGSVGKGQSRSLVVTYPAMSQVTQLICFTLTTTRTTISTRRAALCLCIKDCTRGIKWWKNNCCRTSRVPDYGAFLKSDKSLVTLVS